MKELFSRRAGVAGIFDAILAERAHQDDKYGPVTVLIAGEVKQGPGGHEIPGWLIVIEKELAEAKQAATGHGRRSMLGRHSSRAEILQIAAVCVAALEQHGLHEESALEKMVRGAKHERE